MSIFPTNDSTYSAIRAEESAMVDASELIAEALERSGLSRSQLARALGVSRSEVTARLRGERNITVRKLAATLHVLGEDLQLTSHSRAVQASSNAFRGWTANHFAHLPKRDNHANLSSRSNVDRYLRLKSSR